MILQPSICEICGNAATGQLRVEMQEITTQEDKDVRYIPVRVHGRCATHSWRRDYRLRDDYYYIVLEEGEALQEPICNNPCKST